MPEAAVAGVLKREMPSPAVRSNLFLAIEFVAIFIGIPLALVLGRPIVPPLPLLWLVGIYCVVVLYRDRSYDRADVWNSRPLRSELASILVLFALGAALMIGLVRILQPGMLFAFVRTHPLVWVLVMVLYPVLSVYPQGVIYRSFMLHRYRTLAGAAQQRKWALILLSALAFSFMHIVFRNWVAVALTFAGGILFARRHLETRSLLVSSVEHALYGCFVFTVGLGQFFYSRLV